MNGIIIFSNKLIIKSSKNIVNNNTIFIKNTPNKKCHSLFYILRKPRNQLTILDVKNEKISANKILAF